MAEPRAVQVIDLDLLPGAGLHVYFRSRLPIDVSGRALPLITHS